MIDLFFVFSARIVIFAVVLLVSTNAVTAQQPSAAAVAAAKELVSLKGGAAIFDPLIPGVIETAKNTYLPTNPNLSGELNEVAANLRKDYESKRAEILNEVAKIYARRFSEQEIKDLIAFYKTPLGKKIITEEPVAIEQSLTVAQAWANQFSEEVIQRFRIEMKKKGHDL